MPKIKSAFILHSFPMLYSPECIPELNEDEDFYCLVPTEELALLDGAKWPVVIDHTDESKNSVGKCTSKLIDRGFLFSNDISIDLSKCTIQEIKNFNKWDETSTSFHSNFLRLEPYEFVDTKGICGAVGARYLIKYHIINIKPVHLAIVEYGRTGYKGMLREPVQNLGIDSTPKLDNSGTIVLSEDKILVLNNTYKGEDMTVKGKKAIKVENTDSDNAMEKDDSVENSMEGQEGIETPEAFSMSDFMTFLESKFKGIDNKFMELDNKICTSMENAKPKVENSAFSDDEDEDDDLEDDEDDETSDDDETSEDEDDSNDEDDEDETVIVENKTKKKKSVKNSTIKKVIKEALYEIAPALKNSSSEKKEDERDPYESFANRYKN